MEAPKKKIPIHVQSSQNRIVIRQGKCVNSDSMFDADIFIEDGIINGSSDVEMETLVKQKSVQFFKTFMAYKGSPMLDDSELIKLFDCCKRIGAVPKVRAENGNLIDYPAKKLLPMDVNGPEGKCSFDFDRYYLNLESFRFGHPIIFCEVTESTINLIEPLDSMDGLLVVAAQQTAGRGRANNRWESPKGCAMFSLAIHIPLSSRLGKNLGLVQHLVSLALYRGLTRSPGYEKSDLALKWPNDLYWGRSVKLGGSIVQSSLISTTVRCIVSCGINISNSHPVKSFNQLIADHPATANLPPLTVEEVIARSLNEIDYLIRETERTGIEMVRKFYLQHWLHTDQKIELADKKEVIIKGIDDHGYMVVEDSKGNIMTVEPDGNRFDMMNNLIVKKTSDL